MGFCFFRPGELVIKRKVLIYGSMWVTDLLPLLCRSKKGLLLLVSGALSDSFEVLDGTSDNGLFQMSTYHRKLMAGGTGKSAKGMPPAPKPLSITEARKFWPKWWNESMEAKLQDEVLIGIVATAYVGHKRTNLRKLVSVQFDLISCASKRVLIETCEKLTHLFCLLLCI